MICDLAKSDSGFFIPAYNSTASMKGVPRLESKVRKIGWGYTVQTPDQLGHFLLLNMDGILYVEFFTILHNSSIAVVLFAKINSHIDALCFQLSKT